jgi:superfamily II DNA/RNA helicase
MNISFKNNIVLTSLKYSSFKEIPQINKTLLENLERLNYKRTTVIQGSVIPLIAAGKDVMGFSHTGTGKTLSYLLPVFSKMLNEGPPNIDSKQIFLIQPIITSSMLLSAW